MVPSPLHPLPLLAEIDEFITWAETVKIQQGKANKEVLYALAVGQGEEEIIQRADKAVEEGKIESIWKRIIQVKDDTQYADLFILFYITLIAGSDSQKITQIIRKLRPNPVLFLNDVIVAAVQEQKKFSIRKALAILWKCTISFAGDLHAQKTKSRRKLGLKISPLKGQPKISPWNYVQVHCKLQSLHPFYIPSSPNWSSALWTTYMYSPFLPHLNCDLPTHIEINQAVYQDGLSKAETETIDLLDACLYTRKSVKEICDELYAPGDSEQSPWEEDVRELYSDMHGKQTQYITALLKLLLATFNATPPASMSSWVKATDPKGSNAVEMLRNDIDLVPPPSFQLPLPPSPSQHAKKGGTLNLVTNFELAQMDLEFQKHRDVVAKCVIGYIFVMLKMLKTCHFFMFDEFSEMLIEANCLKLLLKLMHVEPTQWTSSLTEVEEMNYSYISRNKEANHSTSLNTLNKMHNTLSHRPLYILSTYLQTIHLITAHRPTRLASLVSEGTVILKRLLKLNILPIDRLVAKILKETLRAGKFRSLGGIIEGRRWRAANMKIISAIFLRVRPELREEWLQSSFSIGAVEELPADLSTLGIVDQDTAESQNLMIRRLTQQYHAREFV